MTAIFKSSGVPLFESAGTPAMGADCCCTCSDDMECLGGTATPRADAQIELIIPTGFVGTLKFPCTDNCDDVIPGTYILDHNTGTEWNYSADVCSGAGVINLNLIVTVSCDNTGTELCDYEVLVLTDSGGIYSFAAEFRSAAVAPDVASVVVPFIEFSEQDMCKDPAPDGPDSVTISWV